MGKKILFIVPYPEKNSPSQRFRFEQYFDLLHEHGFSFSVSSFLNRGNWKIFSERGKTLLKCSALLQGFGKRLYDLIRIPSYDYIFIHREATPMGPPVFEWVVRCLFQKRMVYDFDDALWITDKLNESPLERRLKWRQKINLICQWSLKISCSNDYLRQHALRFNKNVFYLPTTIDTEKHHNRSLFHSAKNNSSITIGWTGSYSTLKYLKEVESVLDEILDEHKNVTFLVIADRRPSLAVRAYDFLPWSAATEIQDLLNIDIGIMPLPDDEWTRGKGGFKCLQYMALEIPTVASKVGANSAIIDHGLNGFLVSNKHEWKRHLNELIVNKSLRTSLGQAGRTKVQERFSVASNSGVFLSLFR
jgi:glycosyltransferase involved in cell wall biosynthesis